MWTERDGKARHTLAVHGTDLAVYRRWPGEEPPWREPPLP